MNFNLNNSKLKMNLEKKLIIFQTDKKKQIIVALKN